MKNLILLAIILVVFLNVFDIQRENFLNPLPYDSLEPTYYKQLYHNRVTPKKAPRPVTPGYFKQYPQYFEDPDKLKSFYLGYDLTGKPYNQYKSTKTSSSSLIDLNHLNKPFLYPKWYKPYRKEAHYYGYPFYFHGKQHR